MIFFIGYLSSGGGGWSGGGGGWNGGGGSSGWSSGGGGWKSGGGGGYGGGGGWKIGKKIIFHFRNINKTKKKNYFSLLFIKKFNLVIYNQWIKILVAKKIEMSKLKKNLKNSKN